MAHIKEPKGIDFIINSDPLTQLDRKEIATFIKNYKEKKVRKTRARPVAKKIAKNA